MSNFYQDNESSEREKKLIEKLKLILKENKDLLAKCSGIEFELARLKNKIFDEETLINSQFKERDSLIVKLKDKVTRLEGTVEACYVKISELKNINEKTRHELDLLNKEYVFARRKISMLKPSAEEKICVNCRKPFVEEANFNWSCKTHLSQYSGNVWWCCGKTNNDAEGCNLSMHICKDDTDTDKAKYISPNVICTSCKERGHTSFTCPKDPNLKTIQDAESEVERLQTLAIDKLQKKLSVSELNENLRRGSRPDISFDSFGAEKLVIESESFEDINYMRRCANNSALNKRTKKTLVPMTLTPIAESPFQLRKLSKSNHKQNLSQSLLQLPNTSITN